MIPTFHGQFSKGRPPPRRQDAIAKLSKLSGEARFYAHIITGVMEHRHEVIDARMGTEIRGIRYVGMPIAGGWYCGYCIGKNTAKTIKRAKKCGRCMGEPSSRLSVIP